MAVFTYKGNSFSIDNRLDRDLRLKVYPDLMKNDKDNVFIVDGGEGTGKSKFADILGAHAGLHMNSDYNIGCVCLSPEEFRTRIQDCPKRSVVIYDEAHRGMGSRRALSEINNILVDLMMEMRQKNLFVLIVMPTFFMLDKYAALFRTKGLFHVYEKDRKRGFWCFFNEKNKLRLFVVGKKLLNYNVMKRPHYRGRFYNQWSINEADYRAKKLKVFKDKPRITRSEAFKEQRDIAIKLLFDNLNINKTEYAKYLRENGIALKVAQIGDIVRGKFTQDVKKVAEDDETQGIGTEDDVKSSEIDGENMESTDKVPENEDRSSIITFNEEETDDLPGEGEGM